MGFSTLKIQKTCLGAYVLEGKIHTITPSLSGLSFDHVLTFMLFFFSFLNMCRPVCYDVELKFD